MRLFYWFTALILAAALSIFSWYWPNRPKPIDTPWAGKQIASVSFAPFRRGQSPLTKDYPSAAEIEADIRSLAGKVGSLRTYTSREGLEIVPALVGKYGMTVTQSAWLGPIKKTNDAEVAALIEQANRYPDTIKRVIVGNEVLLRKDLSAADLIGHIRRVRQAIKQPVSYADVWEFWLKHPELLAEVDFVTVHFLPYWEDDPVGVGDAMVHIQAVYDRVHQAFPGKPILIGEVGWPSAGRTREGAIPGRWMEAQFINSFLNLAQKAGMDYNLVEAFDQPWKVRLEGTMGGNWGILDVDRRPKFDLAGPIATYPNWTIFAAASVVLGLLLLIFLPRTEPATSPSWVRIGAVAFFAQTLGGLMVWAGVVAWNQAYDGWRITASLTHILLAAVLGILALRQIARAATEDARTLHESLTDFATHWALFLPLGRQHISETKMQRHRQLQEIWIREWIGLSLWLMALYETIMLAVRGRYRDFPIADFSAPALCGLCLALFALWRPYRQTQTPPSRRGEWLPALLTVMATIALIVVDTPRNREALIWCAIALLTALPTLRSYLPARRR